MKVAHVLNGSVVSIYRSGAAPASYKGRMLPVTEVSKPGTSPASGNTWESRLDIIANRVQQAWFERALTTEEKDAQDAEAQRTIIRNLVAALRDGTGTAGERIARLERCVEHLVLKTI